MTPEQHASVDRLYQLPLEEFTAARNALVKALGPDAAGVRSLEKPNLAAWAVNQVYWHRHAAYDAVLVAAEALRAAYRLQLGGKAADVPAAEIAHRDAIRGAKQAARDLLDASGAGASDPVTTAIAETFEALPGTESPGRLSRPLRRVGFGALDGFAIAVRPAARPKASIDTGSASGSRTSAAEARQARDHEARERVMLRERLRFAEAAEREAEAAVERASRAIERADRTCDRLRQELAGATEIASTARATAEACATTLRAAIAERERLATKLE